MTEPIFTICQLVHSLNLGGAEILAQQYATNIEGPFRFVFFCLDESGRGSKEVQELGFAVEVLNRKPGFDRKCIANLSRLIKKHDVGLIHAHQYTPFFYAALSRFAGPKTPILLTEHGRGYPDYRRWKRVLVNRFLLHRRDRVVAVGDCVRDALIENEGLPPARIEVIYNGIELNRFRKAESEESGLRQRMGIEDSDVFVLQVARLVPLKDHATSIRAAVKARRSGAQIQFRIAGDGPEEDSLKRLIQELDAEEFIKLLGPRDDIAQLLGAADIFLLTSWTEGISLALVEAMSAELPCIATRVGGNPEVIVDQESGLLANVRDVDDVARCVSKLGGDEILRNNIGLAARTRVESYFDAAKMHEKYKDVYNQMLNVPQH